jgi:hypothetical protein
MRRRKKRQTMEAEELRKFLKWKRVRCDCGHFCSLHQFSSTLIITTDGKTYCHNCYM